MTKWSHQEICRFSRNTGAYLGDIGQATVGTTVFDRALTATVGYSFSDGGRLLGFERNDTTRSFNISYRLTQNLSANLGYRDVDSTIDYFSEREPVVSVQFAPLGLSAKRDRKFHNLMVCVDTPTHQRHRILSRTQRLRPFPFCPAYPDRDRSHRARRCPQTFKSKLTRSPGPAEGTASEADLAP